MVRISNINTLRQQTINAVTLQRNALKFFMGFVDTRISIQKRNSNNSKCAFIGSRYYNKPNTYCLKERAVGIPKKNLLKQTTTQVYHLQEV
jgi:hypothetical protein